MVRSWSMSSGQCPQKGTESASFVVTRHPTRLAIRLAARLVTLSFSSPSHRQPDPVRALVLECSLHSVSPSITFTTSFGSLFVLLDALLQTNLLAPSCPPPHPTKPAQCPPRCHFHGHSVSTVLTKTLTVNQLALVPPTHQPHSTFD